MFDIFVSTHPRILQGYIAEIAKENITVESVSFAKNINQKSNYIELVSWLNRVTKNGGYRVQVSNGTGLFGTNFSKS